jgi:hypothetical protein
MLNALTVLPSVKVARVANCSGLRESPLAGNRTEAVSTPSEPVN